MDRLDGMVSKRRPVQRGEHAFRVGAPFQFLYAIRRGFFKTYELQEDGQEHITGFHMTGEIMGMDAISTDHNSCNAVALEDSELCEIPFQQLETLCREIPGPATSVSQVDEPRDHPRSWRHHAVGRYACRGTACRIFA